MSARVHAPVVLIVAAALAALLARGVWLDDEVFSPVDLLVLHEPWRAVAPDGHVPGNPVLSDQVTQFQPWFALTAERAADGELPLWNPRAAAGQPLVANLQSAVFSPFAVARRVLDADDALLAAAVAKMLLAAVGVAWLLRRWGRSVIASTLGAAAFAFGGFQAVWLGWPQASTGAFLPLLVALVEVRVAGFGAGRGASRAWGPGFALLVGAMLLCGHVETALHVSLAVGGYAALRLPWAARARESALELTVIAAWSVAGLGLAAVQYGPFVEYLVQSRAYADRVAYGDVWRAADWSAWPVWLALVGGAAAWALAARWTSARREVGVVVAASAVLAASAALLVALGEAYGLSTWWRLLGHPDAYGHPAPAVGIPFTGERSYVELNGAFVGVATWPLAVLGLLCAPRAAARTFGVLGLVAAVAAYRVPGLSALLDRAPLFDVAHNHRLMLVLGFSACALAAFGVDAVRGFGTRPRAGAWGVVAAVLVAFFAARWVPDSSPTMPGAVPVAEARDDVEPTDASADVPGADGIFGGVVPVTHTLAADEPLDVRGWAIAADRVPDVVVTVTQGERRVEKRLGVDDFGTDVDVELPFAWRGHPLARLASFRSRVDVSSFESGALWLSVRLEDGERSVVVEHRAIRRRGETRVALRWWATGGVVVLLLLWGLRVSRGAGGAEATGWALGAAAVVVADVGLFADAYHVTSPPELVYPDTPVTDALVELDDGGRLWAVGDLLLPPNTAGVYGLSDVRSYDALELERFELFLAMLEPPVGRARHPAEDLDVAHPLFALLDVSHVVSDASWTPPTGAPLEVVATEGDVVIRRYTAPRARAAVVPRAEDLDAVLAAAPTDDGERGATPAERRRHARHVATAIGATYAGARDWREVVVVEGAGEPVTPPGETPPDVAPLEADVVELERRPERAAWRVTSSAPAWFVAADAYHGGWRAWVDDEPTEIAPAFFGLRAVPVPAGTSTVEMRYAPRGFRLGALVSGVTLLGLAIAVGFAAAGALRSTAAARRRPAG